MAAASAARKIASFNPSWWQTVLRVKDPAKSLPFYTKNFGMTLVDVFDFPEMKFSVYTLATLPPKDGAYGLKPGTPEAHAYKWTMTTTAIELVYNYGTEGDDTKYHPGNDGHGFGHVAFNVADVYAACATLEKDGVSFRKKPDEGRMKGLAFALDPDGYWIEIVKRGDEVTEWDGYNLSQTMLRIKDPAVSIPFYRDVLGMTLISQSDHGVGTDWGFSLFFLGYGEDGKRPGLRFNPVLELTHNHGTEKDAAFAYGTGSSPNSGYSHLGVLVDDVYGVSDALAEAGYVFFKKPDEGKMKGVAMVRDPDGYKIEIVKRGGAKGVHALAADDAKIYGLDAL
mmetsp:Transcript_8617/g.22250  ORF Transcript_8617/g.22250 Transcript_8617/m.22250 type:complete len:339 (-) Transcript_8617:84-1100(-)|eukprot:CAMPEP_0182926014 /NCGR_PEP_ID=MMETSP0105_2-20130417/10780_1 /TAXON_ID=81532 ORGANISM="Acanthoeca-like sp., Strain 10tr" /NCGR_SAMPLE_ID=MMETSP0105_2 /ASSEMBLY_ACC=CAM_ASM_000205 /LENGTH=338 /DNA_ID=CAMNT_0025063885 /DNA_START=28 /DNA_END=1044 /DNA_ORIENTATION=+